MGEPINEMVGNQHHRCKTMTDCKHKWDSGTIHAPMDDCPYCRIEDLEALASQINTDWIPANQKLCKRIEELESDAASDVDIIKRQTKRIVELRERVEKLERWPHPRAWCQCSVCKSDYRPKRPEDGCPYCKHSELVDGCKELMRDYDERGDPWLHLDELSTLLKQETRDE